MLSLFTMAGDKRPCGLWQLVHFTLPSTIGGGRAHHERADVAVAVEAHLLLGDARGVGERRDLRVFDPQERGVAAVGVVAVGAGDVVLAVLAASQNARCRLDEWQVRQILSRASP
jgi:hypothetical protein